MLSNLSKRKTMDKATEFLLLYPDTFICYVDYFLTKRMPIAARKKKNEAMPKTSW